MQATLLGLLLLLGCSAAYPKGVLEDEALEDVGLTTMELIAKHGYPVESHTYETEDGYILTAIRIPHGLNNGDSGEKRPPALLVHGLLSGSADWVNMGSNSLGYLLADAGYDVWLANVRGTDYSRNHTSLDPEVDKAEFWNYSWHEMGAYDLPATIDHILETTGEEKLHYVGHSQGCTSFLVMGSFRPEYNSKIKLSALLAPAAIFDNNPTDLLQLAAQYLPELQAFFTDLGIYEIPYLSLAREIATELCSSANYTDFCITAVALLGGIQPDTAQLDPNRIPVITSNDPNGASLKQLYHYGQQIANGGFSQYDYGAEQNTILYGTETPPAYDFSKITAAVAVYYGNNDNLAAVLDVEAVASKLPNLARLFKIEYELFNHLDFIFAIDAKQFIYDELITVMNKF